MNKGFGVKLCGAVDFEGMVIDICFNDETLAMLNYDKGVDHIEIEMLAQSENCVFPLKDFLMALDKARKLAIQCAEEDLHNKED